MVITGIEITAPYFIKSTKVKRTLFSLINPENIIPAKAPIGVKNAPILLPIIEA